MPLYDFECKCGGKDAKFFSIAKRNTPVKCECGKEMRRVMGRLTIMGWAKTRGLYDINENSPEAGDRNLHYSLKMMEQADRMTPKYKKMHEKQIKQAQFQSKANGWR